MTVGLDAIDALVARLVAASWKDRDAVKAEIVALIEGADNAPALREHLEAAKKGITNLELRWEVDAVLEATAPPPPETVPEPPKEEPPKDKKQLTAADLTVVYDDPRGVLVHKTKVGDRWFLTQADPRTGQPRTFELHPTEVTQLKQQLAGSPYWVLGAGAAP